MDVIEHAIDGIGYRIGHVLGGAVGIEPDLFGKRLAPFMGFIGLGTGDDPARNAHHGGPLGHVLHHHGIGPDASPLAHLNGAEHLGAGAYHHVVAQGGMALALLPGGPAQGDAVIERAVVPDLGGLADDHAHAVIDEETATDARSRMDLDAGQPARQMRIEPRQPLEAMGPQPVAEAVEQHRVHPRIGGEDLEAGAGRRIAVEYAADVFSDTLEHEIRYAGKRRSLETGHGWVSTGARLAKTVTDGDKSPRTSQDRTNRLPSLPFMVVTLGRFNHVSFPRRPSPQRTGCRAGY